MGTGLLEVYRTKVRRSWKTAFLSAVVIGLLTHLYKFANTLYIRDSVLNAWTDQNIVSSGRWFLSIACGFSSWFDLPWVNGLLSLVLIGLTAAVVADIFRIENPVVLVLTGGLLAVYPAVTATLFYEFTADGYMLAMLLAAFSVRLTRLGEHGKLSLLIGMLCLCLSCGIYQAYVSFALVLAICHFVQEALEGQRPQRETFVWIGRQAVVYGGGLALYYCVWKICLQLEGEQATVYQGIDQVGQFDSSLLVNGVGKVVRRLRDFLLDWNILDGGWTVYGVLNALFLVMLGAGVVFAVIRSGLWKRPGPLFLTVLAIAAVPFAVCIWFFTSPKVDYHPLMLQSLALLYVFAAVLYDRWFPVRWSTAAGIFLTVILCYFGLQANICYYYLDQSYEASYQMAGEVLTRIHQLTPEKSPQITVVGYTFDEKRLTTLTNDPGIRSVHNMVQLLQTDILYDQGHLVEFMRIRFHCDLRYPPEEERERLAELPEVKAMGSWPALDAVQMIDGTVVVKLSD